MAGQRNHLGAAILAKLYAWGFHVSREKDTMRPVPLKNGTDLNKKKQRSNRIEIDQLIDYRCIIMIFVDPNVSS
jgi:hypothetical protein